jgi:N-acetylglucosamine-6-phosphate deacetylase
MMLITDAMSVTGTELASFAIHRETIFRRNGRLETAAGTLAGADIDMAASVRNAHRHLGADLATALAMASSVPARFLRLENEIGTLAPGYRASLVLLDERLNVTATWIDGVEEAVQ